MTHSIREEIRVTSVRSNEVTPGPHVPADYGERGDGGGGPVSQPPAGGVTGQAGGNDRGGEEGVCEREIER